LFEAAEAEAEGRDDDAIALFEAIGASGDGRAWAELGRLAGDDHERAFDYFRLGAESGEAGAALMMGEAYRLGRGCSQDSREALRWYQRSAELGGALGATRAANLYSDGSLGESDEASAERWWRRAVALASEPEAMLGLANLERERDDPVAAVGWAIRAAYATRKLIRESRKDQHPVNSDLAGPDMSIAPHQLEAAIDLVNRYRLEIYEACEADDAEACWHRARITNLGFGELPDPEEGERWLVAAADLGQADALHALAHEHRRAGEIEQFEARLRAAAAQGHATALHDLGFALYSGAFGGEPDLDGAIDTYRKIAGSDEPATATDLSFALEEVAGEEAQRESVRWLIVAADCHNDAAMQRLGERYRDGEGVARDLVAAARWFLAAAYGGWEEGVAVVGEFAGELSPAQIASADRLARGSGAAASALIESRESSDQL
jgi:TPR repeat protein